jgi:hypothetical protein
VSEKTDRKTENQHKSEREWVNGRKRDREIIQERERKRKRTQQHFFIQLIQFQFHNDQPRK